MITLFEEAEALQNLLLDEGLNFFFVGGIPLQIWGRPRLTTDIDLTVFTELVDEDARIEWFMTRFEPLVGSEESTLEFARRKRVLLLQNSNKTEIDIMLGGLADINEELRRSTYQRFSHSISLRVCSAETLLAMKAVAGRYQDFADIESVLTKQDYLDWDYIENYLDQVADYEDITAKRAQFNLIRKSLGK